MTGSPQLIFASELAWQRTRVGRHASYVANEGQEDYDMDQSNLPGLTDTPAIALRIVSRVHTAHKPITEPVSARP